MGPWFDEDLKQQDHFALRVCMRLTDEKYAACVIKYADAFLCDAQCNPLDAQALFFAWEKTGDERYAQAIRQVMQALESQGNVEYAALAFRMAYEMKLNRMERVGHTAAMFRAAHQQVKAASVQEKACFLLAVTDAVAVCTEQLYEHWRALVDIYRSVLAEVLPGLVDTEPKTQTMLLWGLLSGVEMGLIDPERYLPVARKHMAKLESSAAEVLEEVFGVR